jgi:peptidoglycan LD-endopeptidase LytH
MKKYLLISIAVVVVSGLAAVLYWFSRQDTSPRSPLVDEFIRHPQAHPDWTVQAGARCGTAPFILPTSGFIGYLWGDTFDPSHMHQGIDIFSGEAPGKAPVIAAADGYLTRLADWKSSLIIRIPADPLQPGRQIWTYYTHLADPDGVSQIAPDFPPGASEVFVKAGTFLGTQGNFSGTPGRPVGVHLHFSIVLDDGKGQFRNELQLENTLDPTPYLGLSLNAASADNLPPLCR